MRDVLAKLARGLSRNAKMVGGNEEGRKNAARAAKGATHVEACGPHVSAWWSDGGTNGGS